MEIEQGGRSAGTTGLRRPNDRRLFQLLRRLGEASKAELARRAQLTSTAVGTIIQALEQGGDLTEELEATAAGPGAGRCRAAAAGPGGQRGSAASRPARGQRAAAGRGQHQPGAAR